VRTASTRAMSTSETSVYSNGAKRRYIPQAVTMAVPFKTQPNTVPSKLWRHQYNKTNCCSCCYEELTADVHRTLEEWNRPKTLPVWELLSGRTLLNDSRTVGKDFVAIISEKQHTFCSETHHVRILRSGLATMVTLTRLAWATLGQSITRRLTHF
jgi:hypothetical protein